MCNVRIPVKRAQHALKLSFRSSLEETDVGLCLASMLLQKAYPSSVEFAAQAFTRLHSLVWYLPASRDRFRFGAREWGHCAPAMNKVETNVKNAYAYLTKSMDIHVTQGYRSPEARFYYKPRISP